MTKTPEMTKVFVHGNPETAAIWDDLVTALAERGVDDVVRLSPPGFGAPVPEGWDALPASYVAWLAAELERLAEANEGPIDLVGHDWGAGHVLGLAAAHPELIRSWASDCVGLIHPDYDWHDAAKSWQTPGEGEEAVAGMTGAPLADKTELFIGLGLSPSTAASMAEGVNADMGRCILGLYRGAVQPVLRELGDRLEAAERRPGLVIDATDDPYVPSHMGKDAIIRFGAQHLELAGQGHWWMASAPDVAADGLVAFWNGL